MRFSGPVTSLTARRVRHGVELDPHLPAQPFARYKDALLSGRFSSNSLPPIFPPHSSASCTAPPSRASGRAELHLLPAGSLPHRTDTTRPVEKYRSETGWLLFVRLPSPYVGLWTMILVEPPPVPAGCRRLGHATALVAGLVLLSFKLCSPTHYIPSRLYRRRPRLRQHSDWLRRHFVTTPPRLGLVKGMGGLGADCAATRPMDKILYRGDIQVQPHTAVQRARSCTVRNPPSDLKLS
jgi:hypothetical protein